MKHTIQVHQFPLDIYPVNLWITTCTNSLFSGFDDLPIMDKDALGCVCKAYNNDQEQFGIFIRFNGKRSMTLSNISHESTHAALEIFKRVGAFVDFDNQEPFAYLVGWIAKCCEEVRNNKFSNDVND